MIPNTSFLFYINAAVEISAIILLVMILVSSIVIKTKNNTKKAFSLLVLDLIMLLICNTITWMLGGTYGSLLLYPKLYMLDLTLMVLDFFFYSMASIIFLYYICILTGCINPKKRRRLILCFVLFCIVTTGIYASSVKSEWLYYFREDGYIYYTPAYWILIAISFPTAYLSLYLIIKNRKMLKKKSVALLAYLILPMLLAIIDQTFNLSISYVCMAFNALSIYLGVDIENDRILLTQEAEINRQKAENTDMNVKLMVSQIQPHFLYNTLGTIYHLCGKDVSLAQKTIKSFTKYLRTNMESINQTTLVSFEKELEHTKIYLSIELLRFSEVLRVQYDIECTDFELPVLSLQPIVENAVKHGILSREKGGTVTISAKREDGKIYVSVHDDGMGYDTSNIIEDGRVHIGISNVCNRIEYMCNGKLEIQSEIGVGTTATIILEDAKNEPASD